MCTFWFFEYETQSGVCSGSAEGVKYKISGEERAQILRWSVQYYLAVLGHFALSDLVHLMCGLFIPGELHESRLGQVDTSVACAVP